MLKRILVPILSICFFFCVTAKSVVPSPNRGDIFSRTAEEQKYVPNQIIVKYKENAAGLIEKEMTKEKGMSLLSLKID